MKIWEKANTPYAPKGSKYAGRNAKKGEGADCSGSLYAIVKESGFDIDYFMTSVLMQAGKNKDVDSYFKVRSGPAQRGDFVLLSGHVVYYLGKNEKGQHMVYGAHSSSGPSFDMHVYGNKQFNPLKVLYYDR